MVENKGLSTRLGKIPSKIVRDAKKIIGASIYAEDSFTLESSTGSCPKNTRFIVHRA